MQISGMNMQKNVIQRAMSPSFERSTRTICSLRRNMRVRGIAATGHQTDSSRRQRYFAGADRRPIILFDGVCNICNFGVDFALDFDSNRSFRFTPLQSAAGRELLQYCGKLPDDISSIVLVEEEHCSIKSEAILRIAQQLDAPWSQLGSTGFLLPTSLRNVLYDQVANHRYTVFGKRKECRVCDAKLKGQDVVSR